MEKKSDQDAYDELSYYTLAHPDPNFIHQHSVDAYAAQEADKETKPIKIVFALVGLYLFVEKNCTGKFVQQMHMQLAKQRKQWPVFSMPKERGRITVFDVLVASPGRERDVMIHKWCVSVWEAYKANHQQVRELVKSELGI